MQNILVATDLSRESAVVFPAVRQLAEASAQKPHITLCYVIETPLLFQTGAFGPSYKQFEELMDVAEKAGKEQLTSLSAKEFPDLPVEIVAVRSRDTIASDIVRTSKEHNCDLIVVATHGRSGVQRLMLGSVAQKVIQTANCPVLVIPITEQAAKEQ